jgi:hypothetical protein
VAVRLWARREIGGGGRSESRKAAMRRHWGLGFGLGFGEVEEKAAEVRGRCRAAGVVIVARPWWGVEEVVAGSVVGGSHDGRHPPARACDAAVRAPAPAAAPSLQRSATRAIEPSSQRHMRRAGGSQKTEKLAAMETIVSG